MPKRTDIKKIMLIGSGPIVIGQACEFDYSGTQACKALREEGYEIVLINSNPATIMTDPDFADRTYIEPITPEICELIIAKERPDALLPTLGGQTALNTALDLAEAGVLDRYNVELIGARQESIKKAEDRDLFRKAMEKIGLTVPISEIVVSMDQKDAALAKVGLPAIIRPAFTLGGSGGNVAYNREEFEKYLRWGLQVSPKHQVLVEESVLGWKEYELEVMRDLNDNVVIICSIENFDPMGVHTGDSITIAPALTLTDKEYQIMRDAGIAIIREIGVDTGGSNIQFGINPEDGRMVVIEMNPRVSRSSALASKATGFPIAKIAAKLAVGYTLDEITNDITRETPACFEPTIDYVVTKIPRFTFEKFPQSDDTLTTQMKSVGEVMAIGRTFKESLGKALRSLEIGTFGLEPLKKMRANPPDEEQIIRKLVTPNAERIWYLAEALRRGFSLERIFELTKIDPWFIDQIIQIIEIEDEVRAKLDLGDGFDAELFKKAKANGLSDKRIGQLLVEGNKLTAEILQQDRQFNSEASQMAALLEDAEKEVRRKRKAAGIRPVYKLVDTCAAEFEAFTPYLYSTYDEEDESNVSDRKKIIILGGGPNRIGQGIEFDYVCVHGSFALAEAGYETIMINCNPETVSTDYDTSDRLYFEPLTLEDVLEVIETEKPDGVIVQFGGQTPLNLSRKLEEAGVPIIGTSPTAIEKAEDRKIFAGVLEKLGLKQPPNGTAFSTEQALEIAERIGYPTLVRPSFVLGGRAMVIVYDRDTLADYMAQAVDASPERPILVDKYLEDAIEVDVDALCDGKKVVIGGIMEHIEEAGVHSGDSACSLPPFSLRPAVLDDIRRQTEALALELGVVGPMNVQYAVKDDEVFILEVNPRASRTLPFVSKAIGKPLAKFSARIMAGESLAEIGFDHELIPEHFCVKEAVFPFVKFPGVDPVLGPEMKSTGEVMGIAPDFAFAYAKSQLAAGNALPTDGTLLVSVSNKDKEAVVEPIRRILAEGWRVLATSGTADFLTRRGIEVERIKKLKEGRPNLLDEIVDGRVDLIINTPKDSGSLADSYYIRREAVNRNIPYYTTMTGARAAINAISKIRQQAYGVRSLQEYHRL